MRGFSNLNINGEKTSSGHLCPGQYRGTMKNGELTKCLRSKQDTVEGYAESLSLHKGVSVMYQRAVEAWSDDETFLPLLIRIAGCHVKHSLGSLVSPTRFVKKILGRWT